MKNYDSRENGDSRAWWILTQATQLVVYKTNFIVFVNFRKILYSSMILLSKILNILPLNLTQTSGSGLLIQNLRWLCCKVTERE